jgi:SAM-dependent methyltransferase
LDQIRATWDQESGWSAAGDEWSGPWGGTEPLWWGTLFPRIHTFVPTGTVMELGPGHGRWSQFLAQMCDRLILVDVAEHCIDACRQRFTHLTHVTYHVGDGRSLGMVPDASVDFAFSFDSLVHAEADVLESYAHELARTLAPDGVAFLHHSNMGAYRWQAAFARRIPPRLRRWLTRHGLVVNLYAWRAESTTARQFAGWCADAGLACVGQELIPWEYGRQRTDVISLITPVGSRWERPALVVDNPGFMDEARAVATAAPLYVGTAWLEPRSDSK